MQTLEIIVLVYAAIMLIPTLASITRMDQWWIRGFDFPRIQISVLILVGLLGCLFFLDFDKYLHFFAAGLLIYSLGYQFYYIYPYTYLAKTEVFKYNPQSEKRNISVLVSNVLTPNKKYNKLINLVQERKPDILLTLETDKTWEKELEVLEKDYPYTVKIPQDNLYGMHLYSKLELKNIEVKYLVQKDIPSIHGEVILDDDQNTAIKIHCLHPRPPSPTESDTSTARDAELLLVGESLKEVHDKTLVFGDLNDVAWSRTTKLFHEISGFLDPRIGRGFYNTFHADYPLLRWPLDHVFHSHDFTLIEIKREKSVGSDHFPMYFNLNLEPKAKVVQEEPEPDKEEENWAKEKIKDGQPRQMV